jgi:hypothetical protein
MLQACVAIIAGHFSSARHNIEERAAKNIFTCARAHNTRLFLVALLYPESRMGEHLRGAHSLNFNRIPLIYASLCHTHTRTPLTPRPTPTVNPPPAPSPSQQPSRPPSRPHSGTRSLRRSPPPPTHPPLFISPGQPRGATVLVCTHMRTYTDTLVRARAHTARTHTCICIRSCIIDARDERKTSFGAGRCCCNAVLRFRRAASLSTDSVIKIETFIFQGSEPYGAHLCFL